MRRVSVHRFTNISSIYDATAISREPLLRTAGCVMSDKQGDGLSPVHLEPEQAFLEKIDLNGAAWPYLNWQQIELSSAHDLRLFAGRRAAALPGAYTRPAAGTVRSGEVGVDLWHRTWPATGVRRAGQPSLRRRRMPNASNPSPIAASVDGSGTFVRSISL